MEENKKALALTPQTRSLTALAINSNPIALINLSSDLMPFGKADFRKIKECQPIRALIDSGAITRGDMRKVIFALIKNFCDKFNFALVKNLTEIQTTEVAAIFLDECGSFRIEDFVLMFAMAKRGDLNFDDKGRIFDRIDVTTILEIKSNYEVVRQQEAWKIQEEEVRRIEGDNVQVEKGGVNRWPEVLEAFKKMRADHLKESEEAKVQKKIQDEARRKNLFEKMNALAKENGFEFNHFNPDVFGTKQD